MFEKQRQLHTESRRQDAAKLAALEERKQKGNFLNRGMDKLRGVDEQRVALQKNIADADNRIKGSEAGLARQDSEKTTLRRSQEQDVQNLDQQIEQAKEAGYEIPKEPSREISRERGGEGRER